MEPTKQEIERVLLEERYRQQVGQLERLVRELVATLAVAGEGKGFMLLAVVHGLLVGSMMAWVDGNQPGTEDERYRVISGWKEITMIVEGELHEEIKRKRGLTDDMPER